MNSCIRHKYNTDRLNDLNRSFYTFHSMYCQFQSRAELNRLITWAERKRLPHIARYYRWLNQQNDQRITRNFMRFPQLSRYAEIGSAVYQLMFQPKATRNGAGEVYRLRKRSLIWSQRRLRLH